MQKEILVLAARFPVVVADTAFLHPARLRIYVAAPANLITVAKDPGTEKGILVTIQAV